MLLMSCFAFIKILFFFMSYTSFFRVKNLLLLLLLSLLLLRQFPVPLEFLVQMLAIITIIVALVYILLLNKIIYTNLLPLGTSFPGQITYVYDFNSIMIFLVIT